VCEVRLTRLQIHAGSDSSLAYPRLPLGSTLSGLSHDRPHAPQASPTPVKQWHVALADRLRLAHRR